MLLLYRQFLEFFFIYNTIQITFLFILPFITKNENVFYINISKNEFSKRLGE